MLNRIMKAIATLADYLENSPANEYVPIILSPLGGI